MSHAVGCRETSGTHRSLHKHAQPLLPHISSKTLRTTHTSPARGRPVGSHAQGEPSASRRTETETLRVVCVYDPVVKPNTTARTVETCRYGPPDFRGENVEEPNLPESKIVSFLAHAERALVLLNTSFYCPKSFRFQRLHEIKASGVLYVFCKHKFAFVQQQKKELDPKFIASFGNGAEKWDHQV